MSNKASAVDIEGLIKKAVEQGMQAGRQLAKLDRTPYQRTEARLYALPVLVKKVYSDQEELVRLKDDGGELPARSKDLARFSKYGSRVSSEDKLAAVITNLEATISADEHEINLIRAALDSIQDEYYYPSIAAKYFDKISDEEIAQRMHCDDRTIRRQRSRLVKEISVFLYGTEAI